MKTAQCVFLSHSSHDNEFVRKLAEDLKSQGIQVWFDEWEIKVGDSLNNKIAEGIKSSGWLVIILSQNSVKSAWVRKELNAALEAELKREQVFILPAIIDDCEIPLFLQDKKFADFRYEYYKGLEDLLRPIISENLSVIELPKHKVAFNLELNQDATFSTDDRDIEALVHEILYAVDKGEPISFSVKYKPLELVRKAVAELNDKSTLSPDVRIRKISLLRKSQELEEELKCLCESAQLLFTSPMRNASASGIDLSKCLQGLAKRIFSDVGYKEGVELGLDVFRRKDPKISTAIYLDNVEENSLLEMHNLPSSQALVLSGWDLFDLPRNVIFEKAIPAIVVESWRVHSRDKTIDMHKALEPFSWSIGLH
jgi:hypothetical protein